MSASPRPAVLALGAVTMTAATIAAGTWLTDPGRPQVVVSEAVVAPLTPPTPELPDRSSSMSRSDRAAAPDTAEARTSQVESPALEQAGRAPHDPASVWVVVNKRHALDPGHSPELVSVRGHLVATRAATDLKRMLSAADEIGLGLRLVSAHRSYARQRTVYDRAVATRGTRAADRVSARPGHSEHQTGLAVDVTTSHVPQCELEACFADTTAGRWVAEEAWRYGFIVRYTGDNSAVTGFAFEPWHLRYVGPQLAEEMVRTGAASLEEALGVQGGDYR